VKKVDKQFGKKKDSGKRICLYAAFYSVIDKNSLSKLVSSVRSLTELYEQYKGVRPFIYTRTVKLQNII
jgi:hypothetical protein